MAVSEEVKLLPYAWFCVRGRSCPSQAFGTDPEREAEEGCPACRRTAIDKQGRGTEYRLEAH